MWFLVVNSIARSDIASKRKSKHVDPITQITSGPNSSYWNLARITLQINDSYTPIKSLTGVTLGICAPTAESDLSPDCHEDCFLLQDLQIIELSPSCIREDSVPIIAGR